MITKLRLIILAAFITALGCAVTVFAQTDKPSDPIDIAQAKCLKTHHGTMPRAKCYSEASDAWQKEVEDTYAALMKKLSADQQDALKKGQTAWTEYQKQEEGLISSLYPGRGTGYISVRIIEIMQAYKYRAIELKNHLQRANVLKAGN